MGVDFRDGRYTRRVSVGKRTVKEGEAVAIWNRLGQHRQVVGPSLVYLYYSTIRFLDRHVATVNQFIAVEKSDGSIEHLRGPCSVWENPVYHRSVKVLDAIQLLSSADCMIVLEETTEKLIKRVISGPAYFVPTPKERIHEFRWTSSSTDRSQTIVRVQNAKIEPTLMFPGDVSITFSLTYSILDPIHLVNTTDDLTGQMLDAMRADAIAVGSTVNLENIGLKDGPEVLRHFPKLLAFAARLRLDIQEMAILKILLSLEARTALDTRKKTQAELVARENTVKQTIQLADLEIEGESARAEKRNEFKKQELERKIELKRREFDAARELRAQTAQETIAFLQQLNSLNVDLTRFICDVYKDHQSEKGKGTFTLRELAQGLISTLESGAGSNSDD